jgi:hypothetical protein
MQPGSEVALTTEGSSFSGLVRWEEVGNASWSVVSFSAIPKPTVDHQAGKRLSRSEREVYHQNRKRIEEKSEMKYPRGVKINDRCGGNLLANEENQSRTIIYRKKVALPSYLVTGNNMNYVSL